MCDIIVDAKNLICPLPVIRLQQAIDQQRVGSRIKLIATDRGVEYDVPAWLRIHGHLLISMNQAMVEDVPQFEIIVEKATK